jgi:sugar (pentulose or hexulose) kinase
MNIQCNYHSNRKNGFIGVDVGTTHCKAGLFLERDARLYLAATCIKPNALKHSPSGYAYYDPQDLLETVAACMAEVQKAAGSGTQLAVGIASMAESGLLVDQDSGQLRSPVLPWFDQSATPQVAALGHQGEPRQRRQRFLRSGIYPTFKCSLAKILWWREQGQESTEDVVWLPVASYIAYRLSGQMACDYSLAGRTYAFDINRQTWDGEWLQEWGLSAENFPPVLPAGKVVGECLDSNRAALPAGTPVCLAGHDHVCAALAAGVVSPGLAFDSMGTAESFLGAYKAGKLGEDEYSPGLSFGCHVVQGQKYWMGGLSASGGSLEWLRSLLGAPVLSYAELDQLVEQAGPEPSGILYFPYLSGSGSPHSDPAARGAFVVLRASHQRADLVKAVLEGTSYEMEFIRQAAEKSLGCRIEGILAAGGGTRNRRWLQIKADISGCRVEALSLPEAVTLGAAMLSGMGSGRYAGEEDALAARPDLGRESFMPDMEKHELYQEIYQGGFLPLQEPLRELSRQSQGLVDDDG